MGPISIPVLWVRSVASHKATSGLQQLVLCCFSKVRDRPTLLTGNTRRNRGDIGAESRSRHPRIKFFLVDLQIFTSTVLSIRCEIVSGTLALFCLCKEVLRVRKDRYRCLMEARNHKKWLHLENIRECDRLLPTSVRQRRHLS